MCLEGVSRHLQADEIARHLGIAQTTVESHLAHARRKLGVTSSRAAVRVLWPALHTGLGEGFSTIRSLPAEAQTSPAANGASHDLSEKTDSGLVWRQLDAGKRSRGVAADQLGGSGDGDPRSFASSRSRPCSNVAENLLAGRSDARSHAAAPASPFDRCPNVHTLIGAPARERHVVHADACNRTLAALELHRSRGRPDLQLERPPPSDWPGPSPRNPRSSRRGLLGRGDGPPDLPSGFRTSPAQAHYAASDNFSTRVLAGGRLSDTPLGRSIVLFAVVAGLTIPVTALLTARFISLWLYSLFYG